MATPGTDGEKTKDNLQHVKNRNEDKHDNRRRNRDIPKHVKNRKELESQQGPASYIDIQVVGTGASGTPRSVIINFRENRYLFNCGDGTQRIITEQSMKLARLEHIFITKKSWKNVGGLAGMSLSLAGIGIDSCHLHGPANIEPVVGKGYFAAKYLKDFQLKVHDIGKGDYENNMVHMEYIQIHPSTEEKRSSTTGSSSPVAKKKRKVAANTEDGVSVVYVMKPTPKKRAVIFARCVEEGITSGPMIGLLKNNEEVTLPNGKVVRPDQVLEPLLPSGAIIVLECPSPDYLESLVNNERLRVLQTANEGDEPVVVIVHLTPQDVLQQPKYQDWMKGFGENTSHMIINDSCCPTVVEYPYLLQNMLNRLHPEVFPTLCYPLPRQENKEIEDVSEKKVMHGLTGLTFIHRPDAKTKRGFSKAACINHDETKYEDEAFAEPLFVQSLEKLQEQVKAEDYKKSAVFEYFKDKDYPEIVFLGTASASPGKGRNVSAILVHTSPDSCMLLDVGENTDGQIYRHYGPGAEDVFRKLNAVYVSHLHADHHMGLVGVALERRKAFHAIGQEAPCLDLLCPTNLKDYIDSLDSNIIPCDSFFRYTFLEDLLPSIGNSKHQRLLGRLELSKLNLCRVIHVKHSFGLRLDHVHGWSLSYSGDTMPCHKFAELSKDVEIMIHEATMEDEMIEEAQEKRHSTTSQAIEIGKKANAKFQLLTHFSQRYAKVPNLSDNIPSNIGIAFDNMRVKPKQLAILPLIIPPLKHMFPSYMVDMESKTYRRRKNKEKEAKQKAKQTEDLKPGETAPGKETEHSCEGGDNKKLSSVADESKGERTISEQENNSSNKRDENIETNKAHLKESG